MNNFVFAPQVLLRIPRYPENADRVPMEEVLNDELFRKAVYLASDIVYQQLFKANFNWNACSQELRLTLYKYYLRMCHRCTPFGGFSSMGLAYWGNTDGLKYGPLKIVEQSFKTLQYKRIASAPAYKDAIYKLNPALYKFGNAYRYYERTAGHPVPVYQLSEINADSIPEILIKNRDGICGPSLMNALKEHGLKGKDAEAYLQDLVKEQVLLKKKKIKVKCHLLDDFNEKGTEKYCHTSHQVLGFLPSGYQEQLRTGLDALQKLSLKSNNKSISLFKSRFFKLFEQKEVSLLEALDPEIGIDYMALSRELKQNSGKLKEWTGTHQLLFQKMLSSSHKYQRLELQKEDIESLGASGISGAPGIMALFSIANGQLFIHEAGGIGATAIAARFTVFDKQIEALCLELCRKEQEANPDVIFADLVYDAEPKACQINWSAVLRDYQILLFDDCHTDAPCQLPLHDLYICLEKGKLILKSKKLGGKRIIPRLNSAYNYHRSNLGIYRFLCDLQDEGLQASYHFSLEHLFPGLQFYPRVTLGNIILTTAKWVFAKERLSTCLI